MNSLFIGLGGSGVKAVAILNEMLENYNSALMASQAKQSFYGDLLNSKDQYLYIDTDNSVLNAYRNIDHSDFFNLGKHTPKLILEEIKRSDFKDKEIQKRLIEWADEAQISTKGTKSLEVGGDGFRMLARLNLLFQCISKSEDSLLKTLTKKLVTVQQNQKVFNGNHDNISLKPRIYIISGSCGGTGSGILLDILYLIHRLHFTTPNLQGIGQPLVRPVIIMPHGYIHPLPEIPKKTNYRLNAYAFFQELESTLKNYHLPEFTKSAFNFFAVDPITIDNDINHKFNPFQQAFFYDSSSKEISSNYDQTAKKLANFIYQLEVASSDLDSNYSSVVDSAITNDLNTTISESLTRDFVDAYVVPGYFSIIKTDDFLKSYCKLRLYHEVFQFGIIGPDHDLSDVERSYVINEYENYIKVELNNFIEKLTFELEAVCNGNSKKEILQFSEDLTNIAENKFDKEFLRKNIKPLINDFLKKLSEGTFAFMAKFFRQLHLKGAYQAFSILDDHFSKSSPGAESNHKARIEKNIKTELHFSTKDSDKYRKQLIDNFFEHDLKKRIYHVLSNGDEGVFDTGCRILKKYIDQINYINTWEIDFKEEIRIAKNDTSKLYVPDLRYYVNENSEIVGNNNFEKQFKKILLRDPVNVEEAMVNELFNSEISGRSMDSYSVFSVKNNILKTMDIESYFVPENDQVNFGIVQEAISKHLNEWINTEVEKNTNITAITGVSIDSVLNQRSLYGISDAEYSQLTHRFKNDKNIEIQARNDNMNKQEFTVIFGSFANNNQLKTDLNAVVTTGNQMSLKVIEENVESDRIVKLRLELGYNINDYYFYEKEYKPFAEKYFEAYGKNFGHQPFLDKRFIGQKHDGNVYEMFKKYLENDKLGTTESKLIDDSLMVKFFLFYMLAVQKQLIRLKEIAPALADGILLDSKKKCIKISRCEYDKYEDTFSINKTKAQLEIKLGNKLNVNEFPTYNAIVSSWLPLLSSKLSKINDLYVIFTGIRKQMKSDFSIEIPDEFMDLFIDAGAKKVTGIDLIQFYKAKYNI